MSFKMVLDGIKENFYEDLNKLSEAVKSFKDKHKEYISTYSQSSWNSDGCQESSVYLFKSSEDKIRFKRGFENFDSQEDMVSFLKENNFLNKTDFLNFYISGYAGDRIYDFFTLDEIKQLKEYQKELREEARKADEARNWKFLRTDYYADNSVEDVYQADDGEIRKEMRVGPHGDVCF